MIRKFGLYGYRSGKPMEPRLSLLESKIDLVVRTRYDCVRVRTLRSPRCLPYSISRFEYDDRVIAERVTQELADSYVEEGYRERIQRADDTTRFLTNQTGQLRSRLDVADNRIKELERRYEGSLPQELDQNLAQLGRLQDQINMINQQMAMAAERVIPLSSGQGLASSPSQELTILQLKLNELRSQYSDEYPDIVQIKQQIADLKKQIEAEPAGKPEDSVYGAEASPGQSRLEREAGAINAQIEVIKTRIAITPIHGQELAALQRDHDALAAEYNGLLTKVLAAQLSESIEKRHQDERLQVLQSASTARLPVRPNRPAIGMLGFCLSTLAAFALPFGLYFTDTSFKDPDELQSELSIPVVAVIPAMDINRERHTATVRAVTVSFVGILVTTAAIWAYAQHIF